MAEPGGLAASVRRKLDEGQAVEDVIQELVAGGLSRPSAERFVDRALGQGPLPLSSTPVPLDAPAQPGDPDPGVSITDYLHAPDLVQEQQTQQAFKELTQGSFAMTAGILLTLVTLVFPTGGRVFIGLVAVGVWRLIRGVAHCAKLDAPFPWKRVLISIGIPLVVGPVILTVLISAAVVQRARRERAAASAAEQAGTDRIRANEESFREGTNQARSERLEAQIQAALEKLTNTSAMAQCEAALLIGRLGGREHVGALQMLLQDGSVDVSSRNCAASAMIMLGERAAPLQVFYDWAHSSDPERRRLGVMGFGDIGPDAAYLAMPYLKDQLNSPDMATRYIAVETLGKLGPEAKPLLEVAASDEDKRVRDRATQLLKR